MRITGAYQLSTAALLLAGKKSPNDAAAVSLFSSALAIVANIAVYEYFDRPKMGSIVYAALFAVLGKFSLDGKVSPFVATGFQLLIGTLIHTTPKQTVVLYELAKPVSEAGHSMLAASGGTILTTGLYLLSLARGLTQPKSLAVALGSTALLSAKWALLEASALGASMSGCTAIRCK